MMKIAVQPDSPQWHTVHYRLQLVLGIPGALPIKIFKFDAFQQQYSMMKQRYNNKTIINAHYNISSLDQASIKKLYDKKLKISNFIIEAGQLNIHKDSKEVKKSSIVLMKAAVGESECIQTLDKNQSYPLAANKYDSIYLCSNDSQNNYKHSYILKQPDQYALEYQIIYGLQKSRQYNIRDINCYKCIKRTATIYCKQQQAFFCNDCNFNHHKDGLLSSHIRQQLTKYNTIDLCKQLNHNKRLDIYCLQCQKIMCIECIINGWHNTKQYSYHHTKSIKKYSQQKLIQNEQKSIQMRKQLQDRLKQLDNIMNHIDNHAISLQKRINQIYQNVLKELKQDTKYKINQLLIIKIEVKRRYDELVWADSFIRYQQQLLKPNFYVDAQREYDKIKQELIHQDLPPLPKIKVESLEIEGDLKLVQTRRNQKLYSEESQSRFYNERYQNNMYDEYNNTNNHNSPNMNYDYKQSRDKSQSQSEKKSFHSKFSGHKPSLKSILHPPNQLNKYPSNSHKLPHPLQIQISQKQKSISNHSASQHRSHDNTAPLLQKSLKNANLTSFKFT